MDIILKELPEEVKKALRIMRANQCRLNMFSHVKGAEQKYTEKETADLQETIGIMAVPGVEQWHGPKRLFLK